MRRVMLIGLLLPVLAAGWAACGDDDTGPACHDTCAAENDTQCQGTAIQRCALDADGCLGWVNTVDCGDQQQVCDDTTSPASCRLDCLSDCDHEGDSQCSGETTQTCEAGTDGCRHWTDGADCAALNRICDAASGDATCVRDCTDQCSADGDTQCSGTVVETCGLNAKDCLEWVAGQDCSDAGLVCDDSGVDAVCHVDCSIYFPGTPSGPSPADGAADVDPTLSVLDWADVGDATGYAVYLGACPAPAYPAAGFTPVTDSTLTGVSLTMDTAYCWKVVSLDDNDCSTEGPEWSFTTACVDPVAGAPTVTSTDVTLIAGSSTPYILTFSEDVTGVSGALSLSSVSGSGAGTLGAVTPVDGATYQVAITGGVAGDQYRLTVSTGVVDLCGTPLAASVDLLIDLDAPAGSLCTDPEDLTGATFPVQLPGQYDDDPVLVTSCDDTPTNAVWYSFTPTATGLYQIDASNATTTIAYSRLAILEGTGCAPYGTEISCQTASDQAITGLVSLTGGVSYLIVFFTDGDSYTMVDPEISVSLVTVGPGDYCTAPVDLDSVSFPHALSGTFELDAQGGSCDTSATNMVWYSFTAATDGVYTIDATNNTTTSAGSRLAIFDGTGCDPFGAELLCETASGKTLSSAVVLSAGQQVLIAFYTDGDSLTMEDPEIDVHGRPLVSGETCGDPIALTGANPSHSASGTFGLDGQGGSCDTSATNMVWYSLTAPMDGVYTIDATNATTTNAYSRLAVFDGLGCGTTGDELLCETASGKTLSSAVVLSAGQQVLIAFYTDGDSYTMEDPEIDVHGRPLVSGETCGDPIDVSGQTFPYVASGTFGLDAPGGSCDDTATNVIWYAYTAPLDGVYTIDATNATTTNAYSRLAVFDTTACSPRGSELLCRQESAKTGSAVVSLSAGQEILVAFYTDGDSYSMVDPSVSVTPLSPTQGEWCGDPIDVSGQTFPYAASGTFDLEPNEVSCEPMGYNGVWFAYTPTTTGWYAVTGHNAAGDTRVAVFEGADCGALSTELACQAASGGDPSATVQLTAGSTYLVLFMTDADADAMTNPTLDIAPTTAPPPGLSCAQPCQVGDALHFVDGNGHDCWQWTEDQSDTTNDHTFTCDSIVGGDVVAAFTTGGSQSTLHFSASLTNPDTPSDSYVGVEVTESPCSSGSSLACDTEPNGVHSYASSVTVQPSTTYYVWVTDAYTGHYRAQTTLCVW